ncbi:MAG: hypothetical protein OXC60_12760 [Litoreibacter sp.]|nr:hypothetical protein [Litoreibacter sp.]
MHARATFSPLWVFFCAMVAVTSLTTPSLAQERLLAQYVADIGPEDHYNSSGTRLTSFAALIAQDRANYHRFGIRHDDDGADPIFSDRAMRAQIGPGVMDIEDYYDQYVRNILASNGAGGTYFIVNVYGQAGRISRISITVPG